MHLLLLLSEEDTGNPDEEKSLKVITIAITSNQTVHERNAAFHCNKKFIENGSELLNHATKTINIYHNDFAS